MSLGLFQLQIDTTTDSYQNALALQERITSADLEDDAMLGRIAAAAQLSPSEARKRYGPLPFRVIPNFSWALTPLPTALPARKAAVAVPE